MSHLPPNDRVQCVQSFEELLARKFEGRINAFCWPRVLGGDFPAVVAALGPGEGIVTLDEERLRALPLAREGRLAVDAILSDLQRLRAHGLDPALNCIHAYPRDDSASAVATDVFSFHADSAPIEAATWLCTYHGAWSEGVPNEAAVRRVDVPETRAALLREYGGNDDGGFAEFLHEQCYDLHYAPISETAIYPFGHFNLWRIAVEYPGSPVPPCIHRAPTTQPRDPPRLLLIS